MHLISTEQFHSNQKAITKKLSTHLSTLAYTGQKEIFYVGNKRSKPLRHLDSLTNSFGAIGYLRRQADLTFPLKQEKYITYNLYGDIFKTNFISAFMQNLQEVMSDQ